MSNQEQTPENRLRKELPEEVAAGAGEAPEAPEGPEAPEEQGNRQAGLTGRQRLAQGCGRPV